MLTSGRTGASGLVGGEALHQIASKDSGHQISCLVRDAEKASIIKKAYPDVRIVEGDLDSVDIIRKEAKDADVVFRVSTRQSDLRISLTVFVQTSRLRTIFLVPLRSYRASATRPGLVQGGCPRPSLRYHES